jgi:dTDP-4-dehydrorhamnose 3,5-epimerase
MSERADFLYRCTDFYAPAAERAILWNDPDLNVAWPLTSGMAPTISSKDAAARPFRDAEYFP